MRAITLFAAVLLVTIASVSADSHNCVAPNTKNATQDQFYMRRCMFNVYYFTSSDYPAIFAIFAGMTILLALAVLFIVAGMVSMNPGKDSIIYRMTTTRMKKD